MLRWPQALTRSTRKTSNQLSAFSGTSSFVRLTTSGSAADPAERDDRIQFYIAHSFYHVTRFLGPSTIHRYDD